MWLASDVRVAVNYPDNTEMILDEVIQTHDIVYGIEAG
jgi:hypothetical protein